MISLVCLCVTVSAATPDQAFSVSARIDAESLERGKEYEVVIEWKLGDGLASDGAGIPAPILQIEVPRSIVLTGKVLKSQRELSRNEFLRAPFERLIKESPARIGFKVRKTPAETDQLGLNILVYVGSSESGEAWFARHRLELPLTGGAQAKEVSSSNSKWGKEKLLQIGDKFAPFNLPKADGTKVSPAQYLGEQNVIITTYRAHW